MAFVGHAMAGMAAPPPPPSGSGVSFANQLAPPTAGITTLNTSSGANPDTIAAAHQGALDQPAGTTPGARAAAAISGSSGQNFVSPLGQKQLLGS